ncbi:MAG: S-layer homology domain-containing protein, partial [Clostridia bacterium]|nr:S-layer homology domain-containing protein [Clostridia bacterium]
ITGYPDGTFQPDKEVTRAEMAALITRMFNLSSSAVTQPPFSDVEVDYWAAANIVAAKNMNIINGFPDGTFRPQDNVTYEQAVKMIVCALNYGTAAEALGGYPGGYITQASKLNILQKAAYGNDKPAPRGIIAQLLFNSLTVDRLVAQLNADGTVNYVKSEGGNSVLEQFQKTKTLSGVTVVRTPRVNLEPGVTAIQNINSDAVFVKTAAGEYIKLSIGSVSNAFDFVGQTVDVVYREDETSGTKTLTSMVKNGSVMTYENIKLSNVVSLDASGLTYYIDKDNNQTKKLNFAGTTTVIYNERLDNTGFATLNADLFSVSNHTYAEGVISVYIGTNTLVKAKSYKTYVVESTDTRNEVIKVKGGVIGGVSQSNIDIAVPYKDTYVNETVIKKGSFDFSTGKAAANASNLSSYSGISKGNIISVAVNDQDASNKYYEVLVSNTTVNGVINEYTTDDETGRPLIKVGTASPMVVSRDLARYELLSSVQADVNAKFYVDPFGEIGYLSDIKADDVRFGLPVSVTVGGSGFDKITQLEIYNVSTNSVETLRFYDEVDGDPRVNALKDGSGKLITDSLFKYTLKSGKIETLEALAAGTDDNTYVAANSAVTEVSDITKTSSTKITFDGKSITYNSSSTKI